MVAASLRDFHLIRQPSLSTAHEMSERVSYRSSLMAESAPAPTLGVSMYKAEPLRAMTVYFPVKTDSPRFLHQRVLTGKPKICRSFPLSLSLSLSLSLCQNNLRFNLHPIVSGSATCAINCGSRVLRVHFLAALRVCNRFNIGPQSPNCWSIHY